MEPFSFPQSRAERVIAAGRMVLAVSALLAVWFDPVEPVHLAGIAYSLLVAYVAYSLGIAVLVWCSGVSSDRLRWVTQVIDLAFFSLFLYFAVGTANPFMAYFVFAVVCGTMRWQWRGALWTAAVSLAAFLGIGWYLVAVMRAPGFDFYPLLVRGIYLLVIAVLLAYMGYHEERTRQDLSALAQTAAAAEERNRLARDLHDGILQSLTGIGLRLAAVRRLLEEDPRAAREALEPVQRLLTLEQRDLRFFIDELRPLPRSMGDVSLAFRITELVHRIELEWGLRAELRAEGLEEPLPESLAREVYHLVREALVNAARHGEASAVQLEIRNGDEGRLCISISDNGSGFPFEGRLSHAALAVGHLGPRNLFERVASLHGTLDLESSASGARLEIALPFAEAGD